MTPAAGDPHAEIVRLIEIVQWIRAQCHHAPGAAFCCKAYDYANEVEALIRLHADAPTREGWQPIETAPKFTRVLIRWREPEMRIQIAEQDETGDWVDDDDATFNPPAFWMPLPSAPAPTDKDAR